jgi:DivIVA domain-containing protein
VFRLVMRGYDRREVDHYLARLSNDPGLAVPGFAQVMRGYNPEEVDLYIEEVKFRADQADTGKGS